MKVITPIPSPAWVRWREFRLRYAPLLILAVVGVAILALWRHVGGVGTVTGVGEGARSYVTSPQPGWITAVLVKPYQTVKKGDPVAIIQPYDARAQLDLLRSELEMTRLRSQPSLPEQNAMNYERVRVELLQQKSELAMARVNLERAEKDLKRNLPLYREKLISADLYDLSVRDRDLYQAEVEEKSKAVAAIEERLEQLQALGDPHASSSNIIDTATMANLTFKQAVAQTNWDVMTLTAPIDGIIHGIHRQTGEFVLDGEMLIGVNSLQSDRVVGYLRQPYAFDPQVGMAVKVATRTHQRRQFHSQISHVGAQLEYITNSLAQIRPMALVDMGLPFVVDVPHNVPLRPGEVVDILLMPD
ncbi:MAG TPA: efflux RND transporter periplasmic adaptor subunit [Candidatus Paceibacterota bacterium]|nr:efflux RND transporter periplasmic adaptor subunit [Verrucomicrobiota bacterium]HRY46572.1 efflux RND transporter periplasmic adaptor subunit [Candidatus Paceibacterota bacterium]HSA02047.1 efflux RND transporter periplasmic adaptor subunit [Candidatus Paceibacterota bacterium]